MPVWLKSCFGAPACGSFLVVLLATRAAAAPAPTTRADDEVRERHVSTHRTAIRELHLVFGEVGLAGEVRAVGQVGLRVSEAARLGFERCILPSSAVPRAAPAAGIELCGVRTVDEALRALLIV